MIDLVDLLLDVIACLLHNKKLNEPDRERERERENASASFLLDQQSPCKFLPLLACMLGKIILV